MDISSLRVTLEQWQTLVAVVESGGYAQAAEALSKSQSAVTYGIQKLEALLEIKAFALVGRRAVLTPAGQLLYRRARALLDDASGLESAAHSVSVGWEAEIGIAAEVLFPSWLMLKALARFGEESPLTRIELFEPVMSGTVEALTRGDANLAISPAVPQGFAGEPLLRMRLIAVAHPDHALNRLGRRLTLRDLRTHRHLVVRESAAKRTTNALLVNATERWTVSNMATSVEAACAGYGFAWFPEERIRRELDSGMLKPLPIVGGERFAQLYLIFADLENAGPGTQRLAQILRESVAQECTRREPTS